MKKRTKSLPLLVLVAVVALVLGSIGTATAASLTKSQVKKIAAKVVKKKAPTLSVAYAANAGNATLLNGQQSSSYQSPSYRFRLPVGGAVATSKTYTLNGVPAGNYQFAYTAFGVSAGQVACYLQAGGVSSIAEGYNGGSDSTFSTPSGSGVITVAATAPVLNCYGTGGNTFTLFNSTQFVSTISLTRIDSITSGSVTAARSDGTGGRPTR